MTLRPLCHLRLLRCKRTFYGLALLGAISAGSASAATVTISSPTTTPLATSTVDGGAAGDIVIASGGSITLTAGTALTLDSSNMIENNGVVRFSDVANTNGIVILPGFSGKVTNANSITLGDAASSSVLHPDYADNKRGIILNSGGSFTGDIINSGGITLFGDTSIGIDLQGALVGNLTTSGAILVRGDDSTAVRVAAPITGNLTSGTITVIGKNSSGLLVLAPISGTLSQNGPLSITAYDDLTPDPPGDPANDNAVQILQQPGPGIGVGANIDTGILINGPSAASASTVQAVVSTSSSTPALMISQRVPGATAGNITIGMVGTGDDAFGLVNRGTIQANGLYDTVPSQALLIEGWNDGVTNHMTIVSGGLRNEGTIESQATNADPIAIRIGNLASVPTISNTGTIQVASAGDTNHTSTAILLEAGASATTLINSGSLTSNVNSNTGSARVIRDLSGSLTTITNTGFISATVNAVDDGDASNGVETATGATIAADFSATSNDITFTNNLPPAHDPATNPGAANIIGDVLFGSGNDQFLVNAGFVNGAIAFGAGTDLLAINGGAFVQGALSDTDGQLTLNVANGTLASIGTGATAITTAAFGAQGVFSPLIDTTAGTGPELNASGVVSFAAGASVAPILSGAIATSLTVPIVTSPDLQLAGTASSLLAGANIPFIYNMDLTETTAGGIDTLNLVVNRKTAQELGIAVKLEPMLGRMLAVLPLDASLQTQFLTATTQAQFDQIYIQFLPSYTDAMLAMAKRSSQAAAHQMRDRVQDVLLGHRGGGGWASETLFQLSRKAGALERGYDAQGSVLGFGLDDYLTSNIIVGFTFGLDHGSNTENGDNDHAVSIRRWVGGLYAGARMGNVLLSGSATGALVDQSVERVIVVGNQGRVVTGDWSGSKYAADIAASYLHPVGKWYVKPSFGVSYVRVYDEAYTEAGSPAVALSVDSRSADSLEPYAEIVIGRNFNAVQQIVPYEQGQPYILSPELRLGMSYDLVDDPLNMRARFAGDTQWFNIPSDERDQTTFTAGLGLKFITAYGIIGGDINGVMGDNTNAFVGRLNASFRF